jgi:hypothetical protein
MGKKKSAVARAKQAKAKKVNVGSKFGVKTIKSNKFSQQITIHKSSVDGKGKAEAIKVSTLSKGLQKSKPDKVFFSHSPLLNNSPKKNDDEKEEFRRQMASLQEREAASRNGPVRQKKSELLKEGGVVSTLIQSFQPASFSADKTTADLLHETVTQMQSMTGVGQAVSSLDSLPTPIRSNQSWSAIKGNRTSSNPFAPLELVEGESDHESSDTAAEEMPPSTFQMAPASFILLPRTTPTPATTPLREALRSPGSAIPNFFPGVPHMPTADGNDQDIDPDL